MVHLNLFPLHFNYQSMATAWWRTFLIVLNYKPCPPRVARSNLSVAIYIISSSPIAIDNYLQLNALLMRGLLSYCVEGSKSKISWLHWFWSIVSPHRIADGIIVEASRKGDTALPNKTWWREGPALLAICYSFLVGTNQGPSRTMAHLPKSRTISLGPLC